MAVPIIINILKKDKVSDPMHFQVGFDLTFSNRHVDVLKLYDSPFEQSA